MDADLQRPLLETAGAAKAEADDALGAAEAAATEVDPVPLEAQCRVCHGEHREDGGVQSALLSPCRCEGSVRYIHIHCLDEWRLRGAARAQRRATHCELCTFGYRYALERPTRSAAACELLQRSFLSTTTFLAATAGYLTFMAFPSSSTVPGLSAVVAAVVAAGAVLGVAALVDILRYQFGGRLRACGLSPGGALSRARRLVTAATMLQGEEAQAHAEAAAQVDAARRGRAMARAHSDARADAAAQPALLAGRPLGAPAAARVGAAAMPGAGAAVAADVFARVAEDRVEGVGRRLCFCNAPCCAEACCFLSIPPLAWCGYNIACAVGFSSIATICKVLSAIGAVYWTGVAVALFVALLLRPPLRARIGSTGLPQVRSLTVAERRNAASVAAVGDETSASPAASGSV